METLEIPLVRDERLSKPQLDDDVVVVLMLAYQVEEIQMLVEAETLSQCF